MAVDTRRTAHMIISHFPESLKWAVEKLEVQNCLCKFLEVLVLQRMSVSKPKLMLFLYFTF